MSEPSRKSFSAAFTLIELLMVVAIISVLAIVVILTLNPSQLLAQSRDSARLSDIASINSAMNLYNEDVGGSIGPASTTYVSIADPAATSTAGDQCQGIGLPSLPSGDVYHCPASSTYRAVNGTGWIPLDFTKISGGSPFAALPVDPLSQTSSLAFYTYTTNGSQFQLTAVPESQKYKTQLGNNIQDPDYPNVVTQGSNFALSELWSPNGLVGYWPMDEGTGTTVLDTSGDGNNGTWIANAPYYATGKVGSSAGSFHKSAPDYIDAGNNASVGVTSTFSISFWVNPSSWVPWNIMVGKEIWNSNLGWLIGNTDASGGIIFMTGGETQYLSLSNKLSLGTWTMVTATDNAGTATLYVNGIPQTTGSVSPTNAAVDLFIGSRHGNTGVGGTDYFSGSMDDVRLYNRALSDGEVAALYNAEK